MKIPQDGNRAFAIDVARFWLAENGKLLFLLLGLAVASLLGLRFLSRQYADPGVYVEAEVVRFGAVVSTGGASWPVVPVVVRMDDNSLRTLRADVQDVVRCHAGDRIRLVRHGAAYAVSGPACAQGNRPPRGGPSP
ncbi:MAG: hypothetical protein JO276_01150 [Sphingomonadaceae bacterium]|nr:hypothetical protein [Sphingomonadaceae bacterium]